MDSGDPTGTLHRSSHDMKRGGLADTSIRQDRGVTAQKADVIGEKATPDMKGGEMAEDNNPIEERTGRPEEVLEGISSHRTSPPDPHGNRRSGQDRRRRERTIRMNSIFPKPISQKTTDLRGSTERMRISENSRGDTSRRKR